MKTIKLLLGYISLGILASSCYAELFIEDDYVIDEPIVNINQVLASNELWYVDINATNGNGEVPFLQRAFTISFENGVLFANNNIVGIGETGNGFGIAIGVYDGLRNAVEISHDIDGLWLLDVRVVNNRTIELYDPKSRTSYYLKGFQRNNFDYDTVFYDNIRYFLQEYTAWEKIFASEEGALNDFDNENFLQFNVDFFRSSVDATGTRVNNLEWDFEGEYEVFDTNEPNFKTITLNYDFMGDDYFELTVLNDATIELYHPSSKTIYEFKGRALTEVLKSKGKAAVAKKRKNVKNPIMNVTRSKR